MKTPLNDYFFLKLIDKYLNPDYTKLIRNRTHMKGAKIWIH